MLIGVSACLESSSCSVYSSLFDREPGGKIREARSSLSPSSKLSDFLRLPLRGGVRFRTLEPLTSKLRRRV